MADETNERSNKLTVEYYPAFAEQGKTEYVFKKKYGLVGIGFLTELYRFLAKVPKHYYSFNDEFDRLRLIEFIGITEKEIEEMLSELAKTEKIDSELWINHRVILCKDFIESLSEAYKRRSYKPDFKTLKKEIVCNMSTVCIQYADNMSTDCAIKKRKENDIKLNNIKINDDDHHTSINYLDIISQAKKHGITIYGSQAVEFINHIKPSWLTGDFTFIDFAIKGIKDKYPDKPINEQTAIFVKSWDQDWLLDNFKNWQAEQERTAKSKANEAEIKAAYDNPPERCERCSGTTFKKAGDQMLCMNCRIGISFNRTTKKWTYEVAEETEAARIKNSQRLLKVSSGYI